MTHDVWAKLEMYRYIQQIQDFARKHRIHDMDEAARLYWKKMRENDDHGDCYADGSAVRTRYF